MDTIKNTTMDDSGTKSEYFTVTFLNTTGRKLMTLAHEATKSPKEFVKKGVARGAVMGLKAMGQAGEKVHRWSQEGIAIIDALGNDPNFKMEHVVAEGSLKAKAAAKNVLENAGDWIDQGRYMAEGIKTDLSKVSQKITETSPGLGWAGNLASTGFQRLMAVFKIPTKDDVSKLSQSLDRLNERVESIKERMKGTSHA